MAIPVFRPSYGREEVQAVAKALKSGWVGLGPLTARFEEQFSKYIGTRHAVGMNSCTAALHLALYVLGIEKKEVITTPLTFVSTNHAILYCGGVPKFADISEDTLNVDPDSIEKRITKKTKAILIVHFAGHACDMDRIMKIARKHNLRVVEDCAHACGGEYKGKKLGSFGDLACFSFHAVKNLATGEGGMITTNNPDYDKRLRKLRWLGISKGTWQRDREAKTYNWQYNVEELGFKCHMHDISASIGLVQLKKLDSLNRKRRQIVERYRKALKRYPQITLPKERSGVKSSWHLFHVKMKDRDALNLYLQDKGIATSVHYYPNHLYAMYRKFSSRLPVAESVWKRILTLPVYPDLSVRDQNFIISEIDQFMKNL